LISSTGYKQSGRQSCPIKCPENPCERHIRAFCCAILKTGVRNRPILRLARLLASSPRAVNRPKEGGEAPRLSFCFSCSSAALPVGSTSNGDNRPMHSSSRCRYSPNSERIIGDIGSYPLEIPAGRGELPFFVPFVARDRAANLRLAAASRHRQPAAAPSIPTPTVSAIKSMRRTCADPLTSPV